MNFVYLTTQNGSTYVFDMDDREILRTSNKVNTDERINKLNGEWAKVIGAFMPRRGKELTLRIDLNGKRGVLTTSVITEIVRS